jgi:hypothetical protein
MKDERGYLVILGWRDVERREAAPGGLDRHRAGPKECAIEVEDQ